MLSGQRRPVNLFGVSARARDHPPAIPTPLAINSIGAARSSNCLHFSAITKSCGGLILMGLLQMYNDWFHCTCVGKSLFNLWTPRRPLGPRPPPQSSQSPRCSGSLVAGLLSPMIHQAQIGGWELGDPVPTPQNRPHFGSRTLGSHAAAPRSLTKLGREFFSSTRSHFSPPTKQKKKPESRQPLKAQWRIFPMQSVSNSIL